MQRQEALDLLRSAIANPDADFRDGQWEAISALVNDRKRALIVQSTGWGKSIVYFLSTRILRDRGAGMTLIVSPLLALMRNQIAAAEQLGLRSATLNSSNAEAWSAIEAQILSGYIDVLLVSPERLANDRFMDDVLLPIASHIGLFVVDEAHCISDWGHDFRPDYRRIARILRAFPPNLPVLATTATANNRVLNDIAAQLGSNLIIQRGSLTRTSLILEAAYRGDRAERMAWLVDYLPHLPGSGIIYTLTVRDAQRLATWLCSENIESAAYSGKLDSDKRRELEDKLLNNEIKALVATTALGMGFDKPDLGFVIHYQCPASVIHYYQQVGRAGRAIDTAYGLLMGGDEDDDIANFFIDNAFPRESVIRDILDALESAPNGLTIPALEAAINLSRSQIEKALKILAIESPAPVVRQEKTWRRTANPFCYNIEKVAQITALRRQEQQQMHDYIAGNRCLMRFLAEALDDINPRDCGRCATCTGRSILSRPPNPTTVKRALGFLQRTQLEIEPRKQWPTGGLPIYGLNGNIRLGLRAETGMALCMWGDPVLGQLIKKGKYEHVNFDDTLVAALATAIGRWNPQPAPTWTTCVPSLTRPNLVPSLASRLAQALSLPFEPCIRKTKQNQLQKSMQNSSQQARNLDGCFEIVGRVPSAPVLLVDDIVDSRWTMTVLAALLRQKGVTAVFPVALALNTMDE